jgi:uncharacterized protein YdgA (DUF945 family)
MEKIMKKVAGLVIILSVLVLGGIYGMGLLTEGIIKKNVEIMNQTNGLFVGIEHYNRGWFSSDAQIKWRLHVAERLVKDNDGNSQAIPAENYELITPIIVHHGPIIYSEGQIHFGMGYGTAILPLPEEYNQKFSQQFTAESSKPVLNFSVFISYLLHSSIELSLPKFNLVAKDKTGILNWDGMTVTLSMSSNQDKVDGDVHLAGMEFSKDDTKMTLGKVGIDYNLHQTSLGLFLGDANFSLPSFNVTTKNEPVFGINDLLASSSSDIDGSLFNTHFKLGLKSVAVSNKTYGPGALEVSLRNLDADILANINQQANAMQSGSEEERQKAMLAILPELPKLLNKGAELEISKLSMKIPEGDIDGSLLVSLPKGDNANPFELIQKIQGHAKLKVPSALVKQLMQQTVQQQMASQPEMQQALIQQLQDSNSAANQQTLTTEQIATMQADKQIAVLEQNGLVVLSGTDYVVELNLEQGKLIVNGKPFDPSMLRF